MSARADNYDFVGAVLFTNIQGGLRAGEDVPYYGIGTSKLTGPSAQFGSIRPKDDAVLDETLGKLTFSGTQGANPLLPFGLRVHVVATADGLIFCTWTADFKVQFVSPTDVVFSGVGQFTVIGGTGKYSKASGTF